MARTDQPALAARRLTLLLLLTVLATALVQVAITWRSAWPRPAVFDAQMERIRCRSPGWPPACWAMTLAARAAPELIIQIWRADGSMLYRLALGAPAAAAGGDRLFQRSAGGEDWRVYALQTPRRSSRSPRPSACAGAWPGQLALRAVLPVAAGAGADVIVWWVVGHALARCSGCAASWPRVVPTELALPTELTCRPRWQPWWPNERMLAACRRPGSNWPDFTADAAHELRSPWPHWVPAGVKPATRARHRRGARRHQRLLAGVGPRHAPGRATVGAGPPRRRQWCRQRHRAGRPGAGAPGGAAGRCRPGAGAQHPNWAPGDAPGWSRASLTPLLLLRNLLDNAMLRHPEGGGAVQAGRELMAARELAGETASRHRSEAPARCWTASTACRGAPPRRSGLAIAQAVARRPWRAQLQCRTRRAGRGAPGGGVAGSLAPSGLMDESADRAAVARAAIKLISCRFKPGLIVGLYSSAPGSRTEHDLKGTVMNRLHFKSTHLVAALLTAGLIGGVGVSPVRDMAVAHAQPTVAWPGGGAGHRDHP